MSKSGILYKGCSYNLNITVTDQNGDPVNLDTITDLAIIAYSEKSLKKLKSFTKDDLTIDDPATGVAVAEFTGEETEIAELDMYILEYKYKTETEERGEKGYWGRFVNMKMQNNHFEPVS
jgi:hypothetical protein